MSFHVRQHDGQSCQIARTDEVPVKRVCLKDIGGAGVLKTEIKQVEGYKARVWTAVEMSGSRVPLEGLGN